MKVILLKDVTNIGRKGDIKDVNDGYARNFLIARNLGVAATPERIKTIEQENKQRNTRKEHEREHYEQEAKKLALINLVFNMKIGEKGKTFGSVSAKEIREQLHKHGLEVEKDWIKADHIKTTGKHEVMIAFPYGIEATLMVSVEAE